MKGIFLLWLTLALANAECLSEVGNSAAEITSQDWAPVGPNDRVALFETCWASSTSADGNVTTTSLSYLRVLLAPSQFQTEIGTKNKITDNCSSVNVPFEIASVGSVQSNAATTGLAMAGAGQNELIAQGAPVASLQQITSGHQLAGVLGNLSQFRFIQANQTCLTQAQAQQSTAESDQSGSQPVHGSDYKFLIPIIIVGVFLVSLLIGACIDQKLTAKQVADERTSQGGEQSHSEEHQRERKAQEDCDEKEDNDNSEARLKNSQVMAPQ